jgi:hypothetical protein
MALKLLVENPTFDLDYVLEEKNKNSDQTLYIKGPFLMAEEKNKNGRIYPLHEMKNEVDRYLLEMVKKNRSLGELNHPSSCDVNPERACHMINDLWQEGNIFYGKSKILNTPMGNIVKSLIMEGVQLGVSSRALGKLAPTSAGNSVSNLHLICCDVVHDPSVPTAFVDGILESKDWIIQADGSIAEDMEKSIVGLEKSIVTLPTKNPNEYLRDTIIDFLNSIK